MMSARKKQGLPPGSKGAQPRIRIRPHTGKKKRQASPSVAPAVQLRESLNEKVWQRQRPQPKIKKSIQKQNSMARPQSASLVQGRMPRSLVPVFVLVVVAGLFTVVLWSVAGTVSLPILLAVLGIGGGAG